MHVYKSILLPILVNGIYSQKSSDVVQIYPKGSVTQSGPHYEIDLQAYYKFMYTYFMARHNIVKLQRTIYDSPE